MHQPQREHIQQPDQGFSWRYFHRRLPELPFHWHFHPEYELTLTLGCQGQRYVGQSVEAFSSGDLCLLGPNLPHSWHSHQSRQEAEALVIWLSEEWVTHLCGFAEYADLAELFQRARQGLCFTAQEDWQSRIRPLGHLPPRPRLLQLLALLHRLAASPARPLQPASPLTDSLTSQQPRQFQRLLDYLHQHYQQPLNQNQLAATLHLSPSSLQRLCRRHLGQPLSQYVLQLRLGHACSLLLSSAQPIGLIAERAGFTNLANFNRLFRKYKGQSPRQFRRAFTAEPE
ncbi:helix-turn-helix domain-containing protein [Balneatrix alpica]|uniref:Helix-turn-helix domain-containing protein n=1 Tax=Balneatrix alpica TaxID=75684 RepID=A0ABV5ZBM7_9GAMM|nr:AraC family transcriptional regulator [Balneatrix alpica]